MEAFSLPMGDIISLLGLERDKRGGNRTQINVRCPFCNDNKYHCNVNLVSGVYHCVRCNTGGGALDLYARVRRNQPATAENSKELFQELKSSLSSPSYSPYHHRQHSEQNRILCAPDPVLNEAYKKLLSFPPFHLSFYHEKKLKNRGLEEEEILRNGYRSCPGTFEWVKKSKFYPQLLNERSAILAEAKKKEELKKYSTLQLFACIIVGEYVAATCSTERVPGFFKLNGHPCFKLQGLSGILIPTRNERGEIVSMQLRTDNFRVRYMTISSKYLGGPTEGISRIHYPVGNDPFTNETKIFLTEGPLKADVALSLAKKLCPNKKIAFAAMQGVNNTKQANHFFRLVKRSAPEAKVLLAFDMDKCSNPFVLEACKSIGSFATKNGVLLETYCWDPETAEKKRKYYDNLAKCHNIQTAHTGNPYQDLILCTEALHKAGVSLSKSVSGWKEETKGIDDYLKSIFIR